MKGPTMITLISNFINTCKMRSNVLTLSADRNTTTRLGVKMSRYNFLMSIKVTIRTIKISK